MGIWQHEISVTSRGGLSEASPASSFDAEARATWHDGMAACNRQRVLRCAVMTPDVGHGVFEAVRVLPTPEWSTRRPTWTSYRRSQQRRPPALLS
jgi:hypothetical protein